MEEGSALIPLSEPKLVLRSLDPKLALGSLDRAFATSGDCVEMDRATCGAGDCQGEEVLPTWGDCTEEDLLFFSFCLLPLKRAAGSAPSLSPELSVSCNIVLRVAMLWGRDNTHDTPLLLSKFI